MVQADKIAKVVGIELRMPRQCGRLTQRPNYQNKTVEEYYHVAIYIQYLDSIIKTLEFSRNSVCSGQQYSLLTCTDVSGPQQFLRLHGPGKSLVHTSILSICIYIYTHIYIYIYIYIYTHTALF